MFETALDNKDDINRFVKILIDNNIMFENKVYTDNEHVLDAMMLDYSGRLSVHDLQILKKAFCAEDVEVGSSTIAVYLPAELEEER